MVGGLRVAGSKEVAGGTEPGLGRSKEGPRSSPKAGSGARLDSSRLYPKAQEGGAILWGHWSGRALLWRHTTAGAVHHRRKAPCAAEPRCLGLGSWRMRGMGATSGIGEQSSWTGTINSVHRLKSRASRGIQGFRVHKRKQKSFDHSGCQARAQWHALGLAEPRVMIVLRI